MLLRNRDREEYGAQVIHWRVSWNRQILIVNGQVYHSWPQKIMVNRGSDSPRMRVWVRLTGVPPTPAEVQA